MVAQGQIVEAVVTDILTSAADVKTFTLRSTDPGTLPSWSPGAHIDVLVPGGLTRQYSLCGTTRQSGRWRFAVLREPASRGGSAWLHEQLRVGDRLDVRGPRNEFPLVSAHRYVFVAGGIGLTPLLPMIEEVHERGAAWHLTYGGREMRSMAFLDELSAYGSNVDVRPQDEFGLLDLTVAIGAPEEGTVVYCCGPGPLIDAVEEYCKDWPAGALRVERFHPIEGVLDGPTTAFEVVLARSGAVVVVGPDESIAEALDRVGVEVLTSCGEGTCGTCETRVLGGLPDHRDSVLTDEEHQANDLMMLCCSRSLSPALVLDL